MHCIIDTMYCWSVQLLNIYKYFVKNFQRQNDIPIDKLSRKMWLVLMYFVFWKSFLVFIEKYKVHQGFERVFFHQLFRKFITISSHLTTFSLLII